MSSAVFVFPAIKGTQAQREYYISMVPLEVVSRIFQFSDEELTPEVRSQRVLNKSRIPEIRDYIVLLKAYIENMRIKKTVMVKSTIDEIEVAISGKSKSYCKEESSKYKRVCRSKRPGGIGA